MPSQARLLAIALVIGGCLALPAGLESAQSSSASGLLDRYLRGEFDAVVAELQEVPDFTELLQQLKDDGPAWIAAGGPAERERRELVAATLALEAARLGAPFKWKRYGWLPGNLADCTTDPNDPRRSILVVWEPPALLIKWGLDLFQATPPRPAERWWLMAALAVAEYAGDFEFLSSDGMECLYNPKDEIDFLDKATRRFPTEPRLILGQAIREEWRRPAKALEMFSGQGMRAVLDIGPEVSVRLGVILVRQRQDDRALALFEGVETGVETASRDPWVLYLARFLKGQIFERKSRPADAERAYRSALAAVPLAESASTSLSALLFRDGRRQEAAAIVDAMLGARPRPADPWRGYAEGDYRFWPQLIATLRSEIRR